VITYGSLFSGAGGADLGLDRAGMKCLWQCERDKNCAKLLRTRWPDALFSDDVQTFNTDSFPCPNVIWFSSPCQDVSVTGQRKGMAGERSGLFYDATRIIREYAGRGLEFAVWEQVPGVFSSHGGRDFAGVLREMAKCGALDVAWRVLDSKWLGVAQQRARVFLVADFRGERAAEILSLAESMSGDSAPRRESRQDVAPTISARTKGGGGLGTDLDCDGGLIPSVVGALTLNGNDGVGGRCNQGVDAGHLIPDVSYCLSARASMDRPESGAVTLLPEVAFTQRAQRADEPTTETLLPIAIQEVGKRTGVSTTDKRAGIGIAQPGDPMFTLQAASQHGVATPMAVRQLTPTECLRLMSWPDNHFDGLGFADSTKYKACGNGVVANVSEWIGRRVVCARKRTEQTGLFALPPPA
jgi:DNA (cytosine-5)-methyltransferase 1